MPTSQNHLLVLGGRNVGKTTYGAQLLDRLSQKDSAIRLKSTPPNLKPFANARERLSGGISPEHTSIAEHHEITMPLLLPSNQSIELVWPDYGGEQVFRMIDERQVSEQWNIRLQQSTAWMLFLRLSLLHDVEDIFSRPTAVATGDVSSVQRFSLASAAFFVELLQMMLYLKGIGVMNRVVAPKLSVVISCWDELNDVDGGMSPETLLSDKVPLLAQFIGSVWDTGRWSIWGLSAQGKSLEKDRPDEDYLDRGPRQFGYVVQPDGQQSSDITLPLLHLLQDVT